MNVTVLQTLQYECDFQHSVKYRVHPNCLLGDIKIGLLPKGFDRSSSYFFSEQETFLDHFQNNDNACISLGENGYFLIFSMSLNLLT